MPYDIPAPMLAKSVPEVPDQDKVPGGLSYEPKWDGFRGLVSWDGENVEIGSRGRSRSPATFLSSSKHSHGSCPSPVCSTARSSSPRASRARSVWTGTRSRSGSTPRHPV